MKQYFILLALLLFVTGCTLLTPTIKKEHIDDVQGAVKSLIGGKGVTVEFQPGKPPQNRIQGSFNIGLKFKNYQEEELSFDYTLGSTARLQGFQNLESESITIEGKRQTTGSRQFSGPGTEIYYTGQGTVLQDQSIHYGPFVFREVPEGLSTQFYVEMRIPEYEGVSTLAFCAKDIFSENLFLQKRETPSRFSNFGRSSTPVSTGCRPAETLSGSSLSGGLQGDPVIIEKITKTLSSEVAGNVKIQLDMILRDVSGSDARLTLEPNVLPQLEFEIQPVDTESGIRMTCTSPYALDPGSSDTFLELRMVNDKAEVSCVAYDFLKEHETKNYQYQIYLRHPYYQWIITRPIDLVSTTSLDTF